MKYALLAQTHPEYAPRLWREYSLLYHGGHRLRGAAAEFLPRMPGELDERYRQRMQLAAYVNHFNAIVGFFLSNLFTQELTVRPAVDAKDPTTAGAPPIDDGFYSLFARDIDRRGSTLSQLMRETLKSALIRRRGLVGIDLPAAPATAVASLADEDKLGARRAYAFAIPLEQLIDWEKDDDGRFTLAVLHRTVCERSGLGGSRSTYVEEFKCWERDDAGATRWQLFRTPPIPLDDKPNPEADVPLAGEGITSFRQIPIVELEAPSGLWVGDLVGGLAREHFQRRSALNSAEADSLCAIPFAKLGSEMTAPGEALPAEVQQNPNRGRDPVGEFKGRGWTCIGADDELGFAEPSGRAYEIVDKQLDKLVDEMLRVTRQMAASVTATSTSLGRSGLSKQEDRHATEIVLGELGSAVRDCAKRLYTIVSEARGEDVVWTPHGLDKYELVDREALLEEADGLDLVAIPSPTFHKLHKVKLALALLGNVPPDTQDAIQKEIEDGVDEQEKRRKEQADAPPPPAPATAPGVKKAEAPSPPPSPAAA